MGEWDAFQEKLEHQLVDIEKVLDSYKESAKPVDLNQSQGRLSRMDAIQHQQMNLEARKVLQVKKSMILAALDRIDEGRYGECLDCGEEVSRKRLMAMPEATLCLNCQSKRDSRP
jgi:DnaK suppressor protein